jgi:hypothetical protein
MPDKHKPWERMSQDEKVEWLRVAVLSLKNIGNANNRALNERERAAIDRLDAVEAAIRNLSEEMQALRRESEP